MGDFHLQLLGGFRLTGAKDKAVPLRSRKAQALLAYLALNPGPQSREKLATLLWGDRMDEQARHSLRQTLSTLRKALDGGRAELLSADADTVGLAEGVLTVDALEFAEAARDGNPDALQRAAGLYTAPLLDGFHATAEDFDRWLAAERERLHALAVNALERLAGQQERAGEAEAAVTTTQRLLALDPAREAGHSLLMRRHAAAGHRAEALKQYQACAEALRRELDAEPSPETTRLYEEIRDGKLQAGSPSQGSPEKPPSQTTAPPPSEKPSIAVLPFENMSGDPEQEYFSDGLAEDIITDLSRLSGLVVIARQSIHAYRKRKVSVGEVGRELGVAHVLEGSVRKSGNRARVTAQLVEAATGRQVWAERYDRTLDDLFAVQDEITEEVVTGLEVKLVAGEQARLWRKSLKNPQARECYYRARKNFDRLNREAQLQARELYARVIESEPDSPLGYAGSAYSHWYDAFRGWSPSPAESLQYAADLARKALARDPNHPDAHMIIAMCHCVRGKHDQAVALAEKAAALAPSMADLNIFRGMVLYFAGFFEEALASIQAGLRLCPHSPGFYKALQGQAFNLLDRFEEAIGPYRAAAAEEPEYPTPHFGMAVAYASLGRSQEARATAERFRAVSPHLPSLQEYARRHPFKDPRVTEKWAAVLAGAGIE